MLESVVVYCYLSKDLQNPTRISLFRSGTEIWEDNGPNDDLGQWD